MGKNKGKRRGGWFSCFSCFGGSRKSKQEGSARPERHSSSLQISSSTVRVRTGSSSHEEDQTSDDESEKDEGTGGKTDEASHGSHHSQRRTAPVTATNQAPPVPFDSTGTKHFTRGAYAYFNGLATSIPQRLESGHQLQVNNGNPAEYQNNCALVAAGALLNRTSQAVLQSLGVGGDQRSEAFLRKHPERYREHAPGNWLLTMEEVERRFGTREDWLAAGNDESGYAGLETEVDDSTVLADIVELVNQHGTWTGGAALSAIEGNPDNPMPLDMMITSMQALPAGTQFVVFLSDGVHGHYVNAVREGDDVVFYDFQPWSNHEEEGDEERYLSDGDENSATSHWSSDGDDDGFK